MQITNLIDQLLTREGGPLRASPILRDKVAIFADGRCLISRPNGEDVDVISLVALAGRLGVQLKAPEYVDLGSLRSLYADNDAGESGGPRISRDDTSMQREVFDLLFRARQEGASDIHLLVEQDMVTVQMRINGALMPMSSCGASGGELKWRPEHGRQICMTAYAMAAESGTADSSYDPFGFQAGRIVGGLPEGLQAVRLQFNPVGYSGRHMVMRLLYTAQTIGDSLGDLGFSEAQVALLSELADQQTGMVVISGPTGSGKSTTLERLMRLIVGRNPGECVLSVEDPPEYKLPGVIQLPVSNLRSDEDRDVAYADAVAAALRSDPDRIMIGEVRTRATAHHAFKAAMTGHQVLTTLHANDALGVVPRFRDIGVDSYKLRDPSLVRAVLMQRLLKRLCPRCRRAVDPCRAGLSTDLARRLTGFLQGRPVFLPGPGCGAACRQGFVGRTVVAELILPDQKLLSLLCTGERQAAEKHWKEKLGGLSMLDNAILKIGDGHIDPLQIDNKIFI